METIDLTELTLKTNHIRANQEQAGLFRMSTEENEDEEEDYGMQLINDGFQFRSEGSIFYSEESLGGGKIIGGSTELMEEMKSIKENRANVSVDQFRKDSRRFLQKWVDQEIPYLNEQLLEFLMLEDSFLLLTQFITRPASGIISANEQHVFRRREWSNETLMRRSYNTMELINEIKINHSFYRENLKSLFDVFNINSNGNFHHLNAILRHFLKKDPQKIYELLFFETAEFKTKKKRTIKLPLLFKTLDYLHYSEVMNEVLHLLFFDCNNDHIEKPTNFNRASRFSSLIKYGFIEKIFALIGNFETCQSAVEFLSRIIEEGEECSSLHILLQPLKTNSSLIVILADCIKDWSIKKAFDERDAGLHLLLTLLKLNCVKYPQCCSLSPVITLNDHQSCPLSEIVLAIRKNLYGRIDSLTLLLTGNKKNCFLKSRNESSNGASLKVSQMLDILSEIMYDVQTIDKSILDNISFLFWKQLVDWFFEFKENIFCLVSISKMLYLVFKSDNLVTLKSLLRQNKLVTRMIEVCSKDLSNSTKAMSFLLLNMIRIQASSQSMDHYIPSFVNTQPIWIKFVPCIKKWAEDQLSKEHIGFYSPLTKWFKESISSVKLSYPDLNINNLSAGIDVGSVYAYHLGYVPPKAEIKKTFFELKPLGGQEMEDLQEIMKQRHRRSKSLQQNSLGCNWKYPDRHARDDLLMNIKISDDDYQDSLQWNEPYE